MNPTNDDGGLVDYLKGPLTADAVLSALKRGPASTAELAAKFSVTDEQITAILSQLQDHGANVHLFGAHWSLAKQPAPSSVQFVYTSRPNNTFVFGVSSDSRIYR